jgi:hypothetical protein
VDPRQFIESLPFSGAVPAELRIQNSNFKKGASNLVWNPQFLNSEL